MARKYAIVVGDKTDHGGTVLTGDNTFYCNGKPVARVKDTVTCPLCKRTTRIVTSTDPASSAANQGMAFDGDLTDCGAKLISGGQRFLYIDQDGDHDGCGDAKGPAAAAAAALLATDKKPICLDCLLKSAAGGSALLGR